MEALILKDRHHTRSAMPVQESSQNRPQTSLIDRRSTVKSPSEVSECLIRISHSMDILAHRHRSTLILKRIHHLLRKKI